MYILFRPIIQTKKQIALNLFLAPMIGSLLVYLPLIYLLTLLNTVPDPALDDPSLILMMILALFFAIYFLLIYLPLFAYFLILHHYAQFHFISILSSSILITFIFTAIFNNQNFLNFFTILSIFSVPTTIIFIFLTIRCSKK